MFLFLASIGFITFFLINTVFRSHHSPLSHHPASCTYPYNIAIHIDSHPHNIHHLRHAYLFLDPPIPDHAIDLHRPLKPDRLLFTRFRQPHHFHIVITLMFPVVQLHHIPIQVTVHVCLVGQPTDPISEYTHSSWRLDGRTDPNSCHQA